MKKIRLFTSESSSLRVINKSSISFNQFMQVGKLFKIRKEKFQNKFVIKQVCAKSQEVTGKPQATFYKFLTEKLSSRNFKNPTPYTHLQFQNSSFARKQKQGARKQ